MGIIKWAYWQHGQMYDSKWCRNIQWDHIRRIIREIYSRVQVEKKVVKNIEKIKLSIQLLPQLLGRNDTPSNFWWQAYSSNSYTYNITSPPTTHLSPTYIPSTSGSQLGAPRSHPYSLQQSLLKSLMMASSLSAPFLIPFDPTSPWISSCIVWIPKPYALSVSGIATQCSGTYTQCPGLHVWWHAWWGLRAYPTLCLGINSLYTLVVLNVILMFHMVGIL